MVEWTRFIPSSTRIAYCQRQTCQIEGRYEERFEVSRDTSGGNYFLRINAAAYNDGGSYKCTCNGDEVTDVKLKVYCKYDNVTPNMFVVKSNLPNWECVAHTETLFVFA